MSDICEGSLTIKAKDSQKGSKHSQKLKSNIFYNFRDDLKAK